MKRIFLIIAAVIFTASCNESNSPKEAEFERKDLEKPTELVDRMSYTFGYDITEGVRMLDSGNQRVNFDYLIAGIIDGMNEDKPLLDDDERMQLITEIQKIQTVEDKKRYNQKMKEIQEIGESFKELSPKMVEEYKNKDGWKSTESGLLYKVINEEEGPTPAENMVVAANIHGELPNGEVFENTFEEGGKPIDMPIEGLVYGFKQAIMMLSVGDVYKFIIPADIAFGDGGSGSRIPPNSSLKMKIELVEIISTVDEYRKNMSRPPGM
jgi:FKBP-type peptidyl-prolyl cis-trans isomerase